MRKRTRSRELALQLLYQIDVGGAAPEEAAADFWAERAETALTPEEREQVEGDKNDPEVREYAQSLVSGVSAKMAEIDKLIERFAENWVIPRMAFVDRNILRLATYELRFCGEIPVKVAINEAVELAKRYGEPDSSKFVNGILDKIAKDDPSKK